MLHQAMCTTVDIATRSSISACSTDDVRDNTQTRLLTGVHNTDETGDKKIITVQNKSGRRMDDRGH